jgi:hypothetical protein
MVASDVNIQNLECCSWRPAVTFTLCGDHAASPDRTRQYDAATFEMGLCTLCGVVAKKECRHGRVMFIFKTSCIS